MIRYENRCCDCAVPGYPCRGSACPYSSVEVHYCDICGIEAEETEEEGGIEYCSECYEKINAEEDEPVTEGRFKKIIDIMLLKSRRKNYERAEILSDT